MLSSIAIKNRNCATWNGNVYRHSSFTFQRVGCTRPHGHKAFSMPLTPPWRPSFSHGNSWIQRRQPPVRSHDYFRNIANSSSLSISKKMTSQCSNNSNIRHYGTDGTEKRIVEGSNGEVSFEHYSIPSTQQPPNAKDQSESNAAHSLQALSQRLSFFLSDMNLVHNKHARSIIQQYENKYVPLDSMMKYKSIQKFTSNPSMVLEAVNIASNATPEKSPIKLGIEEKDNGEILITRTPPFNYIESIRNSRSKMMVVEGWPKGQKPSGAEVYIRSLLCNDVAESANQIPVAYWRFFDEDAEGVLDIEFESEEGAMGAWDNLERAVSRQVDASADSSMLEVEVQPLSGDQQNRSYQIKIGEVALVARPIDMSMIMEKILLDGEIMKIFERTSDATIPNDEKATEPLLRHKSSMTEIPDEKPAAPSSLEIKHGRYKKWQGKETPSLTQFTHAINQMYRKHMALPPPPREWLHEYVRPITSNQRQPSNTAEDAELKKQLVARRSELCKDVANLVSCVEASIEQGKIRALGSKDGYSLSDSLGRCLVIYSECPSMKKSIASDDSSDGLLVMPGTSTVSPYEACIDVFNILRNLNLDIHPSHFSYAIRAACHEYRWEEAANLFLSQINGDDAEMASGGFVPIDPTLGWEKPLQVGLYAVARDSYYKLKTAEEREGTVDVSPSKRVFETAMKMSMISPSDQETYILAAGIALGRAGLWSDCLDFATDSKSISSYGPPIAVAAMLACIQCSRSSAAIHAYDFFMSGNQRIASEWQWAGGNVTAVKPLCRDLACMAMGNVKRGGFSRDAMRLFGEIINEDCPLSTNAVLGVAQSLEHDSDWQTSIQLLKGLIDSVNRKGSNNWLIVSDAMELSKSDAASSERTLTQSEQNDLLANVLASVMRVCNYEGQYGLAILLCSIANTSYDDWVDSKEGEPAKAILSQKIVAENRQVLEAYIQSLDGLGCRQLLNESHNGSNISISKPRRGLKRKGMTHSESWINAFVSIGRVLEAMDAIQLEGSDISGESRLLFERGLGRAMDHCIDSKQSAAALYLFHHASAILAKRDTSLAGRVKTFFGVEEASGTIFQSDDAIDLKSLRLSDPLLAALIKAYGNLGQSEKARSAFYDGTLHMDDLAGMAQSSNNTLEVLSCVDIDECTSFLDAMNVKSANPSTFIVIAKHYAQNGIWPEIGEVYNRAKKGGAVSEELGLITMQAVCESELLNGKIIVLRKIVEDMSHFVGMRSKEWINAKYWGIKRYVGFHYARLLMRWDDPKTSQKEELLFAINEMRECAAEGIAIKNAPLECIVRIAQVYGTDGMIENVLTDKQRRAAVNLILEACVEANRSGLMKKHTFTTEVVRSLRALKANKECIQVVVHNVISTGRKCRHRIAMEEAMYAALEERDNENLKLITEVFERSGYDPRRLST